MARKPQPQSTGNSTNQSTTFKFKGFVNVNLTTEEKQLFGEMQASTDICRLYESDVVKVGYTLSTKWDAKEGCFRCTITSTDPAAHNYGYCFSMRARDAVIARERVLFVHCELLQGNWSDLLEPSGENTDW